MAKSLTDAELKNELAKYGFTDIGPLTKTTRPVYEKRLEKYRKEGGRQQQQQQPPPPQQQQNGETDDDNAFRRRSTRLKVSSSAEINDNDESTTTTTAPIVPGLANFPKSSKYRPSTTDGKKSIDVSDQRESTFKRRSEVSGKFTNVDHRTVGTVDDTDWGLTISDSDEEKKSNRGQQQQQQQQKLQPSSLFGKSESSQKSTIFNDENFAPTFRRPNSLSTTYRGDQDFAGGSSLWNSAPRSSYASYGSTLNTDRGGFGVSDSQVTTKNDRQSLYSRKPVFPASRLTAPSSNSDFDLDADDEYTKRFSRQQKQSAKPSVVETSSYVEGLSKNLHNLCSNVNQRLKNTILYWKNKFAGGNGQQQRQSRQTYPSNLGGRPSLDDDAYWSNKYQFSAKIPEYRAFAGGDKSKIGYGSGRSDDYRYPSSEKRWWHVTDQTSRFILLALFIFLSVLTISYLGLVHRDRALKCVAIVYYACLDTLDFVYMNMILPLIVVVAVVALGYSVYRYKKYKWHKEAEEQRLIYEMVEKIIATLKKHHEECLADGNRQPYLAVPHVRDMLIPFNRRKEMLPIWDKAVEYLNESESRVRTETQCISGEEFMVWRWLQQTANPNKSNDKMWMGHAFPEEDIPFNMPRCAYYECLKARGLFDPEQETENGWPEHIQDAILEKLGVGVRVVHMAVDMESKDGCVYLKLASKSDAGEAYKILHGSWFNGRLVSVKYLRPERYHERFPDSMKAVIPLCIKKPRHSTLNLPK